MKMTEPVLSICIATLDRADFIAETLETIISQADDTVEVVIVDASHDNFTERIVERYVTSRCWVKYRKLNAKGGVDQDYSRAVEYARGRYCWLMTDDDLLKPRAVRTVLDAIERDPALIIVNAEVRSADMRELIEERRLRFCKNRTYEPADGDQLFADVADYLSFIGCVVIKRDIWSARDKERYYGMLFVHVGVIFQERIEGPVEVIAEPLISIRYGNALWTPNGFEIWMFKWPNLIWSFAAYGDALKERICRKEPWRRARVLLLYRAMGLYSQLEYERLIKPCLRAIWERGMMRVIAAMPGVVANVAILASLYAFYHASKLPLADLRCSPFYYRSWFRAMWRTIVNQGDAQ